MECIPAAVEGGEFGQLRAFPESDLDQESAQSQAEVGGRG